MANTLPKTANVLAVHPDYAAVQSKWELIRDVLEGQECIKKKGKDYLPLAAIEADPKANEERYLQYLERAVFYGVTQRTLEGLVGQVFSKPAVKEFPASLTYLRDDPAGTGITLDQQAKDVLKDLLGLGRGGLWTDFPQQEKPATVKEVKDELSRPVVTYYKPEAIRNWRLRRIGAKTVLSLVVLEEEYVAEDDGFTATYQTQYRVLRLTPENIYQVQIYRPGEKGYEEFFSSYPLNSKGSHFAEIPFVFLGIENNDSTVDAPPLYSLAVLNIAHYRNSADYEEACFMVGQPTLWMSGVTTEWNETVLKGKVFLGSRGGIPLPEGGVAGLLQPTENNLVKSAMDQKEDQMVAIGARLVQSSGVRRTATEVTGDKVSELSVLASAALNTTEAYLKAFKYASQFSGITDEIKFGLSTDFDMARMTSQELLAIFTVWQGCGLTSEAFHDILRRAGLTTQTFSEAVAGGVLAKPEKPVDEQNSVDNRSKPAAE